MKKSRGKRLVSWIVALAMVLTMVGSESVAVFADPNDEPAAESVQDAAAEDAVEVSEEEPAQEAVGETEDVSDLAEPAEAPEAYESVEASDEEAAVEEVTEDAASDEEEQTEDVEEDAVTLTEQTLTADIYRGSLYLLKKNDDTVITLSGMMPEGAVAKAYPVSVSIDDIEILAAYDITIYDADGEEYQPQEGAIRVCIENEAIREADGDLSVYHMENKKATPESVPIAKEGSDSVEFNADSFSIYVVGEGGTLTDENGEEVEAYTVYFYEWVYDESELGEPEIAEEKVVGDDYLNEPEVPEIEGHVFNGWFTEEQDANHYGDGEYPGYKYDFSKTVQENLDSWDGYKVGEGNVINLYSDYDPIYYVYYMTEEQFDEYGNKTNEDVVVFTDEYHENTPTLDTSNAETIYQQSHLSADQAVTSWYYYDENGNRQTIENGTPITEDMELYPVVQDVIWVYFYLGEEAGENVEAVAPIYVAGDATAFGELPVPEMSGYDFAGWYFQVEDGEDVLVDAESNPHDYITDEKRDIDLYAYWEPATVGYTVNIWRQKATDGQLGLDQKVVQAGETYAEYSQYYDYAESIIVSASDSSFVTGATPDTSILSAYSGLGETVYQGTGAYNGFEYNQTRTENDLADKVMAADGSTIINVFYDRQTITWTFYNTTSSPSNYSSVYGMLKGLYGTNITPTNGSAVPDGCWDRWTLYTSGNTSENWVMSGDEGNLTTIFETEYVFKRSQTTGSNAKSATDVDFWRGSSSTNRYIIYYLEVTNDSQIDESSTAASEARTTGVPYTRTINDVTYVYDRAIQMTSNTNQGTYYLNNKFIGYNLAIKSHVTRRTNNPDNATFSDQSNITIGEGVSLGNDWAIFCNAIDYQIDLYSNNGSEMVLVDSLPYKYGADLTTLELPTELDAEKYGPNYYYHFTGTWYEDPSFTAAFVQPSTMPANNLAAYADWELNEVTVTFESNVESDLYDQLVACYGEENVTVVSEGGDGSSDAWVYSIVITAGDELDYTLDIGFNPVEVEGHNYEYGGLLNTNTNKVFNFASQIYTDTTLQLFWIDEQTVYHLQYNLNQGEGSTVTEVLGHGHESTSWAKVKELTEAFEDVEGVSDEDFICWNTEPDGSGTNYYPNDDIDFTQVDVEAVYDEETGEILYYVYNLYAIWAEEKTASLDLEYNYPEGYEALITNETISGTNLADIELINHNPGVTTITITGEDGSVSTYSFVGWAYSADAKDPDISKEDTVAVDNVNEEDNVLYAVWASTALSVEKTANVEEGYEAQLGDSISYTITVTNDGDVTLENITLTDDLTGNTWTITSLDPGETSEAFTTSYTVTEEDILAGSIENVATATAPNPTYDSEDPSSPEYIVGVDDAEVLTEEAVIDWTAEKTLTNSGSGEDGAFKVGETAEFTITVTNTGNVTIEQIDITEVLEGATFVESTDGSYTLNEDKTVATITDLATGEDGVVYVYAEYTIEEKDLGTDLVNSVTTEGGDPEDPTPGPTPGEPIPTEDPNPSLSVEKTADVTEAGLGDEITYTIVVENDGNVTLTDISVTDDLTGESWTIDSLAPEASETFTTTYVVTEEDILAGSIANVATATAPNPEYDPDDPDSPENIEGEGEEEVTTEDKNPHLTVTKEATSEPENGTAYTLGEEITYEITVTNDGNLTITDITLTDELTGDAWTVASLAPGEFATCETSYTVTEEDILNGSVINEVTATGKTPDPENPDVPDIPGIDEEPTEDPNPHLTTVKTTTSTPENGETYALGETIEYEITVTNDGNLTITDIVVTDDLTGDTWTVESLAPEESATFTASYTVTEEDIENGSVINEADVSGKTPDPENPDVPDIPGTKEDPTETPHPSLYVEKTADVEAGDVAVLGQEITYEINVVNNGNVTLTGITVTDDLTGDSWTIESLAPNDSETFTATYVVTEEDILNGSVANVATATAPNPEYDPDDPDSPENIEGTGEEEVPTEEPATDWTVEKTLTNSGTGTDGAFFAGETAEFTITVTNTGNQMVDEIEITETLEGATFKESEDGSYTLNGDQTVATITDLAPDGIVYVYAQYTIQEEDLGTDLANSITTSGGNPEDPNPGPGDIEPIPTEEPEEFYPLDEEIVPGSDDEANPDSWVKQESVNEYDAIEIEMSTTLPKVSGAKLAEGNYMMTFHNQLDSELVLDELDADFIVDINGTPIDHQYYEIDMIQTNMFSGLAQFFNITDGCTFHVNVDLSALYNDGVITDEDLGTSSIRVFFYVDLETVDVNGSYSSTAWYDITADGEEVYTSNTSTVEVYTFEILLDKYDTDTNEALADATFGVYYDESCENAVSRNGEDYTATSDKDGQVMFVGLAEGTYYVKELEAPEGYDLNTDVLTITLTGSEDSEHIVELTFGNTPTSEVIPPDEPKDPVKSADVDEGASVSVGDEITYTITYYNNDNMPAIVNITDSLAEGADFVSATDDGVYDESTHTVTWSFVAEAFEEGSVQLTIQVNEKAADSELDNTAGVQIGNEATVETNTVGIPVEPEDTEPEPVEPRAPEKTANVATGATVAVGDEITYTISYYNHNDEKVDVTITDPLDSGLDFVSATDGGVYDESTHTVSWTIANAAPLEEGSVSLVVKVNETAQTNGTVKNTASVQIGDGEAQVDESSNTVEITVEKKDTGTTGTPGNGGNGGNGGTGGTSGNGGTSGTGTTKTSDTNATLWYLLLIIVAGAAVVAISVRRRRV